MNVSELMTRDPACCTPDTKVRGVARMMMDNNCGEIPVVGANGERKLVGVVTDRDIVCRVVAAGKDPETTQVGDVMSSPVVSVTPSTSLDECLRLMEAHQIRRMPVVDAQGHCCGILSQADVAVEATPRETAELVREVSRPN